MAQQQPETYKIKEPFRVLLASRGWHFENIHGNMFQDGLPDDYICHPRYDPRWVEYKVISSSGTIKFTPAQIRKFPVLSRLRVPIFVIAHTDLRGEAMQSERERLYGKLFKEPNVMLALDPWTQKFAF